MRRHALLAPLLCVALTEGKPQFKRHDTTSLTYSSTVTDSATILIVQSSSISPNSTKSSLASPPISSSSNTLSSLTTSSSDLSAISATSHTLSASSTSSTSDTLSPTNSTTSLSDSSDSSTPLSSTDTINATSLHTTNTSITASSTCTGCIIEALTPTTFTYLDHNTLWEKIEVTETIINSTITYMVGTVIDTIITEFHTLTYNHTQTAGFANKTHDGIYTTVPSFTWQPAPGALITLAVGPTYVAYTNIFGGLDSEVAPSVETWESPDPTGLPLLVTQQGYCVEEVKSLPITPGRKDYGYFIETFEGPAPTHDYYDPISLPSGLIEHLKSASAPLISSLFNGSDIASCTLGYPTITRTSKGAFNPTEVPIKIPPVQTEEPLPSSTKQPFTGIPPMETEEPPPPEPPAFSIPATSVTYISKTYEHTSTHVTRDGCLRCSPPEVTHEFIPSPQSELPPDDPKPPHESPKPPQENTKPPNENTKPPQENPKPPNQNTQPEQSQGRPEEQQRPGNVPTDIPGIIESLHNDPQFTARPQPQQRPSSNEQRITVGDSVVQIRPAEPTKPSQQNPNEQQPNQQNPTEQQPNQQQPNQQQKQNPGVVIGSQTLTPGQTTTMNGVQVIVPSQGGGSRIIVGDSTIAVDPAPTPRPPVLTVGENTITANPQGQFVVGSETLTPGAPPITVDGSTLSLGPGGTIAVVNGATQSLENALPFATRPPVITVDGKAISATVIGGTTVFGVAEGKTLTPGGVVTADGTTFSMPKDGSGSTVVINGVTSTLSSPELPIITQGGEPVTASVVDGTTQFILGPGRTLTPGGVLTVDGTTFSLPKDGSGSTVVVNGVTSKLAALGLPVITLDSHPVSASVVDGTTQFILGPGQTLTPGGVVTIDGTTFSLPKDGSGSTVVVNGVTSTLDAADMPAITLNSQSVTASVVDGTTAFVLGPGQTLTPGGVLTVSGTTFSMPESASGSVIVVDGTTSTLGQPPVTAGASLTISGKTYAVTVRDGTTEYILEGTTLRPGEAVTIDGTTYSLDPKGTALVVNGKTTSLQKTPASNSATTTKSTSESTSDSESSSTTSLRRPGDFVASGVGITDKPGNGVSLRRGGLDKWVEGMILAVAGWIFVLV